MYCLRLFIVVLQFYKNYIVYGIVYMLVSLELLVSITSPSFVCLHLQVFGIAKCIASGRILLFYKNYIVYYNVYHGYFVKTILMGCCFSELHAHLCSYRNVWPEAVCCCFTRTTLFTKLLP